MAKFEITAPDGQTYEVNAPEGATEDDAIKYVQDNLYTPKDTEPKQNLAEPKQNLGTQRSMPSELLRQTGLTVRHGVQGLANTAGIFSDPIAATSNKVLGTNLSTLSDATKNLLDNIGLPSPENARERNVASASELLAGTGGIVGAASQGGKAAQMLAARPDLQASSAVGAGYLGNEAKERGMGTGGQFGAALVGGLGLPMGLGALKYGYNSGSKALQNTINPNILDEQVNTAISQAGINTETLTGGVMNQLREDVKKAINSGNSVSPDALRRLADYKSVGATPMRGNLTLNPVDITRDKNLVKLSANSSDLVANQLPMLPNKNNAQLISNLNTLGANTTDDVYAAGSKIISALDNRNNAATSIINNQYKNAKATNGRSASLDPSAFTNKANDLLDFHNAGGSLPVDIRTKLNSFADGSSPLTVDTAEQFKTNIARLQRNSPDGNVKFALGKVREALDDTPLLSGQEIGEDALGAFNKARSTNRAYMQIVEKTPALQAVRDGVEPDKFVSKFILGNGTNSNLMDVAMLKKNIKGSPEAMQAIRGQILAHLKNKGVGGAADEVAMLSPSNYNKALESIGERKLNLFFEPQEIEQLKRIGRVASYENVQPKGSAVNNSNTAAAAFTNVIDFMGKYIPFGESVVSKPAQNIATSISGRGTLDASKALQQQAPRQPISPLLIPLGLLSAE